MRTYPKIQSVYLRDPENNHKTFIQGSWSMPEFGYLKDSAWEITEKVDGTNIRVGWDGSKVRFGGRTDEAQIPTFLFDVLSESFTPARLGPVFGDVSSGVTLYGEGYGRKIQKAGSDYIEDGVSFILFDVQIGDLWLERYSVIDIAESLEIQSVPVLGEETLQTAIDLCRGEKIPSCWPNAKIEGYVLRPKVTLLDRQGRRIITKVKTRDFA